MVEAAVTAAREGNVEASDVDSRRRPARPYDVRQPHSEGIQIRRRRHEILAMIRGFENVNDVSQLTRMVVPAR